MTSASENGGVSASDAPRTDYDKPIIGSVGLLVEDCEMPDIDWEAYDDPVEPEKADGNNSEPTSEKPSSQPVVNERSDQVTPDPHSNAKDSPNADNRQGREKNLDISHSMAFLDLLEPDQNQKRVDSPPKLPQSEPVANGNDSNVAAENHPGGELHKAVQRPPNDDNGKTGRYFQSPSWRDRKQNRRKKTPGSANRLYCDLCDVYCTGQKTMNSHLKGRGHKGKARQKALDPINKELDKVYEDYDVKSRAEIQQRMEDKRRRDAANSAERPAQVRDGDMATGARPTRDTPPQPAPDAFGEDNMEIDSPAAPPPGEVPHRSSLEEARPPRSSAPSAATAGGIENGASASIQQNRDTETPEGATPTRSAPPPGITTEPRKATSADRENRPSEGVSAARNQAAGMREQSPPRAQRAGRGDPPRGPERAGRDEGMVKDASGAVAPPPLRVDAPPAIRLRSEPISPRLRSEPISPRLRSEPAPAALRGEVGRAGSARGEGLGARRDSEAPAHVRSQRTSSGGGAGGRVAQNVAGGAVGSNWVKPVAWDPYASMFDAALVGKEGKPVPDSVLDGVPSMSEWREMRHCVFEKGDDVDKLAFKLMQEILLSPTLGIQASALDDLDRALKKIGAPQFYSKATGGYSYRKDFPEKMWKREQRFIEGDEQWMKEQSAEDKAMHLFCENLHYTFEQGEDYEEVQQSMPFSSLPYRGGVTGFRSGVSKGMEREGGRTTKYEDSVELDKLFQAIHQDRIDRKNMELRRAYELSQARARGNGQVRQ